MKNPEFKVKNPLSDAQKEARKKLIVSYDLKENASDAEILKRVNQDERASYDAELKMRKRLEGFKIAQEEGKPYKDEKNIEPADELGKSWDPLK